jgi:hypothetical protein
MVASSTNSQEYNGEVQNVNSKVFEHVPLKS